MLGNANALTRPRITPAMSLPAKAECPVCDWEKEDHRTTALVAELIAHLKTHLPDAGT